MHNTDSHQQMEGKLYRERENGHLIALTLALAPAAGCRLLVK